MKGENTKVSFKHYQVLLIVSLSANGLNLLVILNVHIITKHSLVLSFYFLVSSQLKVKFEIFTNRGRLEMGDSSSCSEVEVFQEDQTYWGKSKKNYYESEDESASGSEAEMLLEETLKIQKKQASLLEEHDFFDPESFTESHKTDRKNDLISSDVSSLLDELTETLRIVSKKIDAPLEDFLSGNLLAKQKQEISIFKQTESSIDKSFEGSFERAKNSLLFNYAQNIVFYLFLKSQGIQTEGHPVISHLVKVKLLLEKIKPLEAKLSSFVSSTLKNGNQKDVENKNEIMCKPNLDDFLDEEDDEKYHKKSATYKAPRIAPVKYNDVVKRPKETARMKPYMKDMQDEFDDRPEEVFDDYLLEETPGKSLKQSYEEDNFTRFSNAKGKEFQRKLSNELTGLNSFGDKKPKKKAENGKTKRREKHRK